MTNRIAALDPTVAEGSTKTNLDAVQKMLGAVPNLFRVAANAPATLEALVGMFGATGKASLSAKTRNAIALTVAEANRCDYCLSAHTYLGKAQGVDAAALERARDAASDDPKTATVLRFARAIVAERGRVAPPSGLTDQEVLDTIAVVVLNIFTNYLNTIAETEIDFPVVRAR